jgi:hypothetical protein
MRFKEHVTLNFNNIITTAAVFLDNEKAFATTRHLRFLNKLKILISLE